MMLRHHAAAFAAALAFACASPAAAQLSPMISESATVGVDIATPTTTELIPLAANKVTYVTFAHVEAAGTGNFKFVYGTGTNCGTGTTSAFGGNISLTAQTGFAAAGGVGAVLVVPRGKALCAVTSAAVQYSGWLTYSQF